MDIRKNNKGSSRKRCAVLNVPKCRFVRAKVPVVVYLGAVSLNNAAPRQIGRRAAFNLAAGGV